MRPFFARSLFIAGTVALLAIPALMAADDLSIVPLDATTVGVVHLNEMRTSPISGRLFRETDRATVDGETERFFRETGLRPAEDVDTVVLAMSPDVPGEDPRALVAFFGRFNAAKLTAALIERGAVRKTTSAGSYLVIQAEKDSDHAVISIVDNHLALAGNEEAVTQALVDRKNGGSGFVERAGLAQDLYRIDPSATAWMLVDVPRSSRFKSTPVVHDPSGKSDVLTSALQKVAVVAVWATDDKDSIRMGGSAVSSDEETRSMIEDMLRGMLAAWRLAVQDKKPELVPVLRRFQVSERDGAVTLQGTIPGAMIKDWAAASKTVD